MPRRSRAMVEDDDVDIVAPSARRRRSDSAHDVSDAASNASDDADGGETQYSNHDQMVKKLVRLALAHEAARRPIRRQDVAEKVLGNSSRAFKRVFEDANKKLQHVFGMTMAELPQKERITMQQKRQAQRAGTQSQGSSNSNKSYIVTSTLHIGLRRPGVLQPIKAPSVELEAQYTGLYTWVVAVITLSNNKRISENKLDAYLQKMNAGETVAGDRTDKILKRMEREGYITKIRERDGTEEIVDWVLGPRAKIEIGEAGVAGIVRSVWGLKPENETEMRDLENKLEVNLGEGSFKRKTDKTAPPARSGEGGEAENDGEAMNQDGEDSQMRPSRRSTRRSRTAEDEEEEEDEDEEEEPDGEINDGGEEDEEEDEDE